jgi:uncharacterized repeat protein (TIGR03803 family)
MRENLMLKLGGRKRVVAVVLLCAVAVTATASFAQTFNTLLDFSGADGAGPQGTLVQGTDGNLYGTTKFGGANSAGTVFKLASDGKPTTLYSFCSQTYCYDGAFPAAGLVLASNGNFYGTTWGGGAINAGTIFEITPKGRLTILYNFCSGYECPDGAGPSAGLVQGSDGNFYGTTLEGGAHGFVTGAVFKISRGGTFKTLYSFCSQSHCRDGQSPIAGLVQGSDGNFYGTTYAGGANCIAQGGCGTAFKITPAGKLTTLHSFCAQTNCTDGANPTGTLVQSTNGSFYGTTALGGTKNQQCSSGCGTIFQITSAGKLATLHTFNQTDGEWPYEGLIRATDGSFYGTTYLGGTRDGGTVFKMDTGGKLKTLHSFTFKDGDGPQAGLAQITDGTFDGTTSAGGSHNVGTVFHVNVGLGPFVETVPSGGKVGVKVLILGTNLTGTTSVSFHGMPASFKVISSSEIETKVPNGATTGEVKAETPRGTLVSNVAFRVTH